MPDKTVTADPLALKVCCLTCRWKGKFGHLKCDEVARCPNCGSPFTHPIGKGWPDAA